MRYLLSLILVLWMTSTVFAPPPGDIPQAVWDELGQKEQNELIEVLGLRKVKFIITSVSKSKLNEKGQWEVVETYTAEEIATMEANCDSLTDCAYETFKRGNADGDADIDVNDEVYVLAYLYSGGPMPDPPDSGDCEDDGDIDYADYLCIHNHNSHGGSIDPPHETAGLDPTADTLNNVCDIDEDEIDFDDAWFEIINNPEEDACSWGNTGDTTYTYGSNVARAQFDEIYPQCSCGSKHNLQIFTPITLTDMSFDTIWSGDSDSQAGITPQALMTTGAIITVDLKNYASLSTWTTCECPSGMNPSARFYTYAEDLELSFYDVTNTSVEYNLSGFLSEPLAITKYNYCTTTGELTGFDTAQVCIPGTDIIDNLCVFRNWNNSDKIKFSLGSLYNPNLIRGPYSSYYGSKKSNALYYNEVSHMWYQFETE